MRQFINLVETAQANDLSFIDRAIAAVDEAGVLKASLSVLKTATTVKSRSNISKSQKTYAVRDGEPKSWQSSHTLRTTTT